MPLIEMVLQAQQYIPGPPGGTESCWKTATRNDSVTVDSWYDIWINQTKENAVHDFSAHSAMLLFGQQAYKPVILAGSGPSLKKNWQDLTQRDDDKNRGRQDIKMVSCLHNFGFMEDRDLMGPDDYYITLDAGDITLREVTEGGTKDPDWYWERTKDRTLVAYTAAYPELIRKWKGPVYWFLTPWATSEFGQEVRKYADHAVVPCFSVGGCVLGAAWYFAMACLGASIPIFIGADFSFGYDRKFHAWDSRYDKQFAGVMPWTDIYGNRVFTWPSYHGFKSWFDHQACGGQGGNAQIMINATEGGIMGSYPEGNIQQIIQLDLRTALHMYTRHKMMPDMIAKSGEDLVHILF